MTTGKFVAVWQNGIDRKVRQDIEGEGLWDVAEELACSGFMPLTPSGIPQDYELRAGSFVLADGSRLVVAACDELSNADLQAVRSLLDQRIEAIAAQEARMAPPPELTLRMLEPTLGVRTTVCGVSSFVFDRPPVGNSMIVELDDGTHAYASEFAGTVPLWRKARVVSYSGKILTERTAPECISNILDGYNDVRLGHADLVGWLEVSVPSATSTRSDDPAAWGPDVVVRRTVRGG